MGLFYATPAHMFESCPLRMCIQYYRGETSLDVISTARLSVGVEQTKTDNDVMKVATIF